MLFLQRSPLYWFLTLSILWLPFIRKVRKVPSCFHHERAEFYPAVFCMRWSSCFSSFLKNRLGFLCRVFAAARGLSLTVEWRLPSSGAWAPLPSGCSCHRAQALECSAFIVAACGLNSRGSWAQWLWYMGFIACGIFPGQVSNPCHRYWQADFYPLYHQASPAFSCLWIMWIQVFEC